MDASHTLAAILSSLHSLAHLQATQKIIMTRKRQRAEAQQHEQGPAELLGPGIAGANGVEYTSFAVQGRQYSVGAPCLCGAVAASVFSLLGRVRGCYVIGSGAAQPENSMHADIRASA